VFLEEEIRIYYGGSDGKHTSWRNGFLCLATLRPDGFAGYEPIAGETDKTAAITTRALAVGAGSLCVSADVAPPGYVKVAVLDKDDKPLAEGELVTTTATDTPIDWKDGFSLKKDQQIKLRFELREAKLFSFSFKD